MTREMANRWRTLQVAAVCRFWSAFEGNFLDPEV